MNRNALLVYLKTLRDLEFAKHRLENMRIDEKFFFDNKVKEMTTPKEKFVPMKSREPGKALIGAVMAVVGLVLALYFLNYLINGTVSSTHANKQDDGTMYVRIDHLPVTTDPLMTVLTLVAIAAFTLVFVFGVKRIIQYFRRLKVDTEIQTSAEQFKQSEAARVSAGANEVPELRRRWISKDNYLAGELQRVKNLLSEMYGMNILATQYRNLASVYYIYDYMSTSQAGLSETLMHEHMENGIQRILAKLDVIIEQNERIILQNSRIEAQNKQIVSNTENMLNSMANIETNTAEAAHYSQVSAAYSKAAAYFTLANYFQTWR